MSLHFLCIQRKQPPHDKIALLPTPFWQTPQGTFPDLFNKSNSKPPTIIFVFPMFFRKSNLLRHLRFQCFNFTRGCRWTWTRQWSCIEQLPWTYVRNCLDRASNKMMKRKGLRTCPGENHLKHQITGSIHHLLLPDFLNPCTWTGPGALTTLLFQTWTLPTS